MVSTMFVQKQGEKKDLDYVERLKKAKTKQNQSSITHKARHYDVHVNRAHSYDYFCNLTLFMIQITVISFIHLDYILLVGAQPKQLLI